MSVVVGLCAICQTKPNLRCPNCAKVFYCGHPHMVQDRFNHKDACFPARLKQDGKQGPYYVATRHIPQGELIFQDPSMVSGPSSYGGEFKRLCLGCNEIVTTSYQCSKCKWPVCSKECEIVRIHSQFECIIFEDLGILPSTFTTTIEYKFISILRLLLYRDNFQSRWTQLMRLKSLMLGKSRIDRHLIFQATVFIRERCRLNQFWPDEIEHVLRILSINAFDETLFPFNRKSRRSGMYLFYHSSFVQHSCSPNTYWTLNPIKDQMNASKTDRVVQYQLCLRSAIPIRIGQTITRNYIDVDYGTEDRRRFLNELYYILCSCQRCRDPKEFGTFLSAIKCKNCQQGQQLPTESSKTSTWACLYGNSHCGTKIISEQVVTIKRRLVHDVTKVLRQSSTEKDHLKIIAQYEKVMAKYSGRIVHINHWILLRFEYTLIEHHLSRIMPINYATASDELYMIYVLKLIAYCQHWLSILNATRPGHNLMRGRLLYFHFHATLIMIEKAIATEDILQLKYQIDFSRKIVREGRDILLKEPKGSLEFEMGQSLCLSECVESASRDLEAYFSGVINS